MSNQYILDEYLVKLGFTDDKAAYARFESVLRNTASVVDNQFNRMTKNVLTFEAGAIGMFAAVGSAAIGFFDRVAMADQEYRLLALHMYTSLPVARSLKIALDALGQPLENIMWDPELAMRFHQLVKDQRAMAAELGPGFEQQMLKIRDVRFEFTRFGVELKYLTMLVVEDLAKAFGTDIDGMLQKLRNINDYIISHMPEIADFLATRLKPILVDVYNVMKSIFEGIQKVGPELAKVPWGKFIDDIAKAVIAMVRLEQNLALLFSAGAEAVHGNYAAALKDLAKMTPLLAPSTPETAKAPPSQPLTGAGRGLATPAAVKAAIIEQARAFGIPPELALSVARTESGFRQFDDKGNILRSSDPKSHATGIFQLQPGTARNLGVDPTDAGGNIMGGVKLLKQLLDRYHDTGAALEHYYGSKNSSENKAYAAKVMKGEGSFIGEINITVQAAPGMDEAKLAKKTAEAIQDTQKQAIQRNLSEFQTQSWSY